MREHIRAAGRPRTRSILAAAGGTALCLALLGTPAALAQSHAPGLDRVGGTAHAGSAAEAVSGERAASAAEVLTVSLSGSEETTDPEGALGSDSSTEPTEVGGDDEFGAASGSRASPQLRGGDGSTWGPGMWHRTKEGRTWYGAYRTFPDRFAYCVDAGLRTPARVHYEDAKPAQAITSPETAWALFTHHGSSSTDVQAALSAMAKFDAQIPHRHVFSPRHPRELGEEFRGAADEYRSISREAATFAGPYSLEVEVSVDDESAQAMLSLRSAAGALVPGITVDLDGDGARPVEESVVTGSDPTAVELTDVEPAPRTGTQTITVSATARGLPATTVDLHRPTGPNSERVQNVITAGDPGTAKGRGSAERKAPPLTLPSPEFTAEVPTVTPTPERTPEPEPTPEPERTPEPEPTPAPSQEPTPEKPRPTKEPAPSKEPEKPQPTKDPEPSPSEPATPPPSPEEPAPDPDEPTPGEEGPDNETDRDEAEPTEQPSEPQETPEDSEAPDSDEPTPAEPAPPAPSTPGAEEEETTAPEETQPIAPEESEEAPVPAPEREQPEREQPEEATTLPRTGSTIMVPLGAALALIGIGGVALSQTRRR